MATSYIGYRPVLKGRTSAENINTYTGKAEEYSNWSLMNPSQVLDGFPDRHVTPGAGDYPGDYFMSYILRGGHHVAPMVSSGLGNRLDGFRDKPLEYKGLASAKAFPSGYGHVAGRENDYGHYSNWTFDGLASSEAIPSATLGHAVRYESPINSFGSFGPYVHKGTAKAMPAGYGQALPANNAGDYGHNRVLEWTGVPSSKAL